MTELINLSKAKEMLNLIDGEFSDEGSCPECGSEVLRCKDCVIKLIESIYNSFKDNVDCELENTGYVNGNSNGRDQIRAKTKMFIERLLS